MWIDQNRNGKKEKNEPGLPYRPITVEITKPAVSSKSPTAITTDENGLFSIPDLDAGSWTIAASQRTPTLEKTFDSTNGTTTNWIATTAVPVNGVGEADFAAAGIYLVTPICSDGTRLAPQLHFQCCLSLRVWQY